MYLSDSIAIPDVSNVPAAIEAAFGTDDSGAMTAYSGAVPVVSGAVPTIAPSDLADYTTADYGAAIFGVVAMGFILYFALQKD